MKKIIILLAAVGGLAGCNLGMAPSGGDASQVEANFKNMSPKDRIQVIKLSPASAERKAQLIQQVEKETGYKDPDSGAAPVAGGSQSHPAPGAAPVAGQ